MSRIHSHCQRLTRDESGTAYIEYLVLTVVVALAAVLTFSNFQKSLDTAVELNGDRLGEQQGTPAP